MKAVHRLLTVVGTLLLLLGTIAGVLHREVLDADRFADHVDAVRADPAVGASSVPWSPRDCLPHSRT